MIVSPTARRQRIVSAVVAAALASVGLVVLSPVRADAATLPAGFTDSVALSGLSNPTVFRFAADGRVFVGEKSGRIKVFDNLSDTTPTIFADLRTNVHAYWDRGLLGLELSPQFPTDPSVYVLYTHDAAIGGTAPRWGTAGVSADGCPTPPGATDDGCVVSSRLSRLQAAGNVSTGTETVLVEDWCQQYPSHSTGDLAFGADGALYASAGDGASFIFTDYGQDGDPLNPCGDPPAGVGGVQTPPSAEGGSLRSQDLRTSGDPVGLSGTVIRVDPATGAGLQDNPLASSTDPNARRIVAHGFRNPFRFTMRPGTNEVWVGDVGAGQWEEIDRIPNPTDGNVRNFGWPCYEGTPRKTTWDNANFTICENLYAAGSSAVSPPYFSYHHNDNVVPGEACPTGSSSIAGLSFAFAEGGNYPADYRGGLYFADYSRDCIWQVPKGADGLPDMSKRRTFVAGAANPVDLQIGPGGDLFYADFGGGAIRRISYTAGNTSPTAVVTGTPTSGPTPLTVAFDGSHSSDPDAGDTLTYAWDLDGDGQYDDSTAVSPTFTYNTAGTYTAGLTVTDNHGAFDTETVTITAGNTAPTVRIDSPTTSMRWKVGDKISFSGSASDPEDGSLPASALSWSLRMQHCPSNCHSHTLQDFPGVASGSFVAPDHEYPSYLELQLTARDSGGLTSSQTIRLDPLTTTLDMRSDPAGLQLEAAGVTGTTPFSRTVIAGSKSTINALTPQALQGTGYEFASWSNSGAQSHDVTAGTTSSTYTATYRPAASSSRTFAPAADARVEEANPASNYGTATTLGADGGTDPDVVSYLKFDVSGVSGSVTNVKLRLHTTSNPSSASADGPAVYGTGTGWTESGITWSNRPARTTAKLADKGAITSNTWLEYDVTGVGITGDGTYGFVVATVSADGTELDSREAASFQPELIVTSSGGTADTTPPDTTITSGPTGTVTSTSATFEFSSTESGSTFACSLDGAAYQSCTSPKSYSGLAATAHTLSVRATDPAGNTDPTPATQTWTISPPATASRTFSAVADARVVEASPASNYGTATTLVADGGADPDVESNLKFDVSGVSGSVTNVKLRLHTTSNASSASGDGPAVFGTGTGWTETGITWNNRPARTTLKLADKGAITANTWLDYDVTGAGITGDGTYAFVVATVSADGTELDSREAASFQPELIVTSSGGTADTTPPDTTITSGPTGTVTSTGATFEFSSTESGSTFACSLDGAAYQSCSSPKSYSGLAATAHTLSVRATDPAGNTDPTPATQTWTISPPATVSRTFAPSADARVEEASPASNYGTATTLGADGGTDPDVESNLKFDVSGVSGSVTNVKLRLHTTSNPSSASADGPAVYGTGTGWTESGITWSNRPARTTAKLADKGAITSNTWLEYDVTGAGITGDGSYGFVVATSSTDGTAFDSREATSFRPELIVTSSGGTADTTPPNTTITSGPTGTVTSTSATFEFSSTESGSTFACSLDGAAYQSCTSPKSYSGLAATAHTLSVRATDPAGNTDPTPATQTWTISPPATASRTFSPVADARVVEASPASNYGSATTLVADGGADPDVESNLKFDVSGVSGSVTNVKLRLHTTSNPSSASADGPAVYGTGTGWTETGITWSNRPARTTAKLADKAAITSNTWLEYDVTGAGITGNGTYGFVVATISTDGTELDSREGP